MQQEQLVGHLDLDPAMYSEIVRYIDEVEGLLLVATKEHIYIICDESLKS